MTASESKSKLGGPLAFFFFTPHLTPGPWLLPPSPSLSPDALPTPPPLTPLAPSPFTLPHRVTVERCGVWCGGGRCGEGCCNPPLGARAGSTLAPKQRDQTLSASVALVLGGGGGDFPKTDPRFRLFD